MLLGYLLTNAIVTLYFIGREKISLQLHPRWPQSWDKVNQAAQLLLWTMMFIFLTTLDRVFISDRLGILSLGFFGISLLISNLLYNSADVVLQVLFPKANALIGSTGDSREVGNLLLSSAETLSYILSAALGLGFLLLPVVVPFLLPRYEPGIPAARIICPGLAWLVLAQLISVAYIVLGRVQLCLLLQFGVLAVKAAMLLAVRQPQLTTVAVISSAANLLYLVVMVARTPVPGWRPLKAISRLAIPWLLVGVVLWITEAVFPATFRASLRSLLPSLLFLAVTAPILWFVHHRTRRPAHV